MRFDFIAAQVHITLKTYILSAGPMKFLSHEQYVSPSCRSYSAGDKAHVYALCLRRIYLHLDINIHKHGLITPQISKSIREQHKSLLV